MKLQRQGRVPSESPRARVWCAKWVRQMKPSESDCRERNVDGGSMAGNRGGRWIIKDIQQGLHYLRRRAEVSPAPLGPVRL